MKTFTKSLLNYILLALVTFLAVIDFLMFLVVIRILFF